MVENETQVRPGASGGDAAEPDAGTRRAVTLITEAGKTLLENGGEVFRAQQTMQIMADALNVPDFHCYVLTNGVFASADGRQYELRYIPPAALRLDRVEAVNALSRRLAGGAHNLESAEAALQKAATLPGYRDSTRILAGACGAAFSAYLFGGGLAEMALAALAGTLELLLPMLLNRMVRTRVSRIFSNIAAAFFGAFAAFLCAGIWPVDCDTAIIGALMLLTPGVALTMGVNDLLNSDYLSGAIRVIDAVLIAGCVAGGVAIAWLANRPLGAFLPLSSQTSASPRQISDVFLWWVTQIAAAGVVSGCFGVIFRAVRRHALPCAVTGAVGWFAYLVGTRFLALSAPAATLLAALPLAAVSRWFAVRHNAPSTIFLLCGIIPLVPGAGIYHTISSFLQNNRVLFSSYAADTVKIALGLVLGITLVLSLPLPKHPKS